MDPSNNPTPQESFTKAVESLPLELQTYAIFAIDERFTLPEKIDFLRGLADHVHYQIPSVLSAIIDLELGPVSQEAQRLIQAPEIIGKVLSSAISETLSSLTESGFTEDPSVALHGLRQAGRAAIEDTFKELESDD